jgi:hypothetical protein
MIARFAENRLPLPRSTTQKQRDNLNIDYSPFGLVPYVADKNIYSHRGQTQNRSRPDFFV